jgi:hypothetical protein
VDADNATTSAPPIQQPLPLGEVLAETIRVYGARFWAALSIGALLAGMIVLVVVASIGAFSIAPIALVFALAFAVGTRVVAGDSLGKACVRTAEKAPVLVALTLIVTVPLTIAMVSPLFLLLVAFWLGLTGFAIPVAMVEEPPANARGRLGYAITRSFELGRADYLHAVGVLAALLIVYGLGGRIAIEALRGFAENGEVVAFVITQVVLAPLFFLGVGLLYFEQRARAISSR